MRLEGTYSFAAPRAAVWDALMDPAVLANALPGGEAMTKTGENDYKAVMNVKVGPVQGRFEGKIALSDLVPLTQYTMKVDGQGAPGFVAGEGQLLLTDHDDGGTLLSYTGDVQVGGRIAGLGQRLVESTAKSLTRQGLTALDQMIQDRIAPPLQPTGEQAGAAPQPIAAPAVQGATPRPVPPQQPSLSGIAAEVAKDVVKDLAGDYIPADIIPPDIPAKQQERVLYFTLGALAMLIFVLLVRLVQDRD